MQKENGLSDSSSVSVHSRQDMCESPRLWQACCAAWNNAVIVWVSPPQDSYHKQDMNVSQAGFDSCFSAFQIRDRNRYDLHSLLFTLHSQMGGLPFTLHNQSQEVTQFPTSLWVPQPQLANHFYFSLTISRIIRIMSTP